VASEIVLTGLIGSNSLGALAAFGLLRACSQIEALRSGKLAWRLADDWTAVLTFADRIDRDALIKHLVKRQEDLKTDIFKWSDDIRVKPEVYRARLTEAAENATATKRGNADYYAAFGSETVTDGSKKLVKPTAFHMTSGQMRFLKSICEVAESVSDNRAGKFTEALFGPWKYDCECHGLFWDHMTERLYALRDCKPSDEKPRSVSAAVWFGIEAMPLFPTVRSGGKLATTGFVRTDGVTRFVWPIWTQPVGLDGLRTLLGSSELLSASAWDSLGQRGITAIYESVRSEFGKGYAVFRPATVVWSLQ
jgi:hypothetical protein